jgi:hypothetical protein
MQSKSLQTCPSKVGGLYAAMEWGLRNIAFLGPYSFCGNKDNVNLTFHCHMQDYDEDFNVYIPQFTEKYIMLIIPNKKGDNSVLLTKDDCADVMGSKVSMKWIANKLRRKWEMKISRTSTT